MKILVIEDQDAIRKMIEAMLSAQGYQVLQASDGSSGLAMARSESPDIVLVDLQLPGRFDGFEVCQQLRIAPETKSTAIVVISANASDELRDRAFELGANSFYGKPFSPTALLKVIESLGRKTQSLDEPIPMAWRPLPDTRTQIGLQEQFGTRLIPNCSQCSAR
jgi:DNA-binding response OmpR family regulator